MVSRGNLSTRQKLPLGLVAWPQPLWALLCTLMAFGIALATVSRAGTIWVGVTIAFFGLTLALVGTKSRGYAEISKQNVVIAPTGEMGRKATYARRELRAIEVGEGGTLVLLFGMSEKCQLVVEAFHSHTLE